MIYILKSCPFCGKESEIVTGEHNFVDVKIRCASCFAEGPLFDCDNDQPFYEVKEINIKEAIEHWNSRI